MAKKKDKSASSDGDDKKGSDAAANKRMELVTEPEESQAQTGRFGLGLVLSFPLGWSPLMDAFNGRGAFEIALGKYLLVVLACVAATTTIGNLLDKAPKPQPNVDEQADALADQSNDDAVNGESTALNGQESTNEDRERQNAPLRS